MDTSKLAVATFDYRAVEMLRYFTARHVKVEEFGKTLENR
jgi:ribosomal protein L31E